MNKINNWGKTNKEYDFTCNERDPYKETKISIVLPAHNELGFQKMIDSLAVLCTDFSAAEILVKIDSENSVDSYVKYLMGCPFRFKTLVFPRYHAYWDQHLYVNNLCRIASGKVFWSLGDDMVLKSGDWVKSLMSAEGRHSDNIYAMHIGEHPTRPLANPFPAVSREWFDFFGFFAPTSTLDSFVSQLAKAIGRYEPIHGEQLSMHHEGPHGYMKNDKGSPLAKKREFVEKVVKKNADKFNGVYIKK